MTNRNRVGSVRFALVCLLAVVCVCVLALGAVAQEEPEPDLDALEAQYNEAYGAEDYPKALEIAEQMAEITWPRHIDILYNLARLHYLLGDKMEAYEYLFWAIDSGYWDIQRMRTDEAFETLREEDLFKKLARSAWANGYLWMLERDEREDFQQTDRVMEVLDFQPGDRVADVGAGSGYFTIPVAKAVGPTGVVWAIDVFQDMLDYIDRRLQAEQLENVELKKVERDDPDLPPGGVDTILMVDTWHYIRDPEYAKKLRSGLAPGGRVVVIDYRPKPFEERPWGPTPEQQTPREELDRHFAEAGLVPIRVHDFLTEQYFVEYGVQ